MSQWRFPVAWQQSKTFIFCCAALLAALLVVFACVRRPVELERINERRKAADKVVAPEAYVPVWLYKGLKLNIAIAGALLLASPWMGRRASVGMRFVEAPERPRVGRAEIIGCVLLMGIAGWHNAPRLTHSMWGDEEFNAARFVLEEVTHAPDGSLTISPRDWTTTLWNMRKPTNHLGYSFLARLSHEWFFRKGSGAEDPWFSEALLRMPVYIAGLLLIPAFFWALRVWGLRPWCALVLMLLHPWYLRFGTDGRGYGLIMLGATVLLGIAGRALQTGQWRWWICLGFGCFFLIWSNLQGVYIAAALHLMVAAALGWRVFGAGALSGGKLLTSRWVVSGMVTTMLVVGYLAPCWPQLQEFLARKEIAGVMDAGFWKDGLTGWFFGRPWIAWEDPASPIRLAMQHGVAAQPLLHWLTIIVLASALIMGTGWLWKSKSQRPLLVFALGAPALMLLHMAKSGNRPYDWYFSIFIPGLFLVLGAAWEWPALRRGRWIAAISFGVVAMLYTATTHHPRQVLRHHPLEEARESVAHYRRITNPRFPGIEEKVMSGGCAMFSEGYDPALHRFRTVGELRELMARAAGSGKQFFVNVGSIGALRAGPATQDICAILEDGTEFEHVGRFWGLLPYTTRDVFRAKTKDEATLPKNQLR